MGVHFALILFTLSGVATAQAADVSLLHASFEQHGRHFDWHGTTPVRLTRGGDIRTGGVTLWFPGARRNAEPEGERAGQVSARRYTERSPRGALVSRFTRVRYRNLYPGIDLVFHSEAGNVEYDFELAPHADPRAIRIACRGARLNLNHGGDIRIASRAPMIQRRPRATQKGAIVAVNYVPAGSGMLGIAAGKYNDAEPLTIDPVLNFASFLSGPGFEAAYAMAVDAAGSIYITGESDSIAFNNAGRRSSRDIFIAKFDAAGANLQYLTYLGGSGTDTAKAIAIDSAGNAYVTGSTSSRDFPATRGVIASSNAGFDDAFVAKFDSGGGLVYATLLGSSGSDQGAGIAIDNAGNAYIAGITNGAFPTTSGALQRPFRGGSDCFVSKLSADAATLIYSTLLGGAGLDACRGIAVDTYGNAYVTGFTSSPDFPVHAALQSALKGSTNAFVSKINPDGSALVYSTFIGGGGFSEGNAIAIDTAGSAYVAGDTMSWNFPVTSGAAQSAGAGDYDAFVLKLSTAGDALTFSTLLGGNGADAALSIGIDPAGRAVVGGFTSSTNFPQKQTLQSVPGGQFDAFAAVVDSGGYSVLFSTYLGGSGDDRAYALATAAGNRVYLAGATQSADFPRASTVVSGNSDIFVAQMSYDTPAASGLNFIPLAPCRAVDTRAAGFGSVFGPPYLKRMGSRVFPLLSSTCQIPASAQAYSLNITAVPRGPLQYMTIWPDGQAQPLVSTLNAADGRVVANAALVPAGTGGAIAVYVTDDTDVLIDINGYFAAPSSGLAFYALTPCRIADTRSNSPSTSAFGYPYLTGQVARTFPIPQSPCAPAAVAQAYSLNLTAVPRTPVLEYMTAWPAGQAIPPVSTLNAFNGQVVANAAILGAGSGGAVNLFANRDADAILDINGYFASPGSPGALSFTPVSPCRVVDTRNTTPIGTSDSPSRSFDVTGSPCGIPPSARAYALNFTAVPFGDLGFLQTWPTGQAQPTVSTLNSSSGAVVANAAIVPAGLNGKINVFASSKTHVVIDINGYFAP